MKSLLYLYLSLLFICFAKISSAQSRQEGNNENTLSGNVITSDGSKLQGAIVYIQDLKVGAEVHAEGTYIFNHLPKGVYLVQVSLVGYAPEAVSIAINGATTHDFTMESSSIEEPVVVITGNSLARSITQTPQQTTEVSNQYIEENSSTNVIDAISKTPGVSAMTDGQSISKPVIRGLGYNRVLTVNDGVEQVDQAWFDEFGIEADPDAVDRYEILKGPASLAYGSDAIAGVVNLIPERSLPEGEIKGDILSNYQSNNGLIGTMFHIAGTNDGISWGFRADYTLAHAYQNAYDGYALNTQFNNFNIDGTVGIHRKWGYSQLHASYFNLLTGIVDGTRDSATGDQERAVYYPSLTPTPGLPFTYVIPTNVEQTSYTPFVIYQRIQHIKLVWDNSIAVGQGRITGIFSFQQNQRQETNDPTNPNTPDIYYFSRAATYDVRYVSQNYSGFDFSAGINGIYQASQSLGTLLLIPNYNIFQIGAFAIANYHYKILTLSGGVRFDNRLFTGKDDWVDSTTQQPVAPYGVNGYHEFTGFNSSFNGVSASLGATLNFKHDLYLKLNAARGFRAPNVAECAANGVHDGTVVWELGDSKLKPETSYEEDLTFGYNGRDVSFELDLFDNYIADFIYAKGLLSVYGGDSINNTLNLAGLGAAPVYKYTQGPCNLYGGEFLLDIHPFAAQWIDISGNVSLVQGGLLNVPDSIKVLPFVPPTRFVADVRFNLNKIFKSGAMDKGIKNSYIKFGLLSCMEQKQVYLQYSIYNGLSTAETPQQYAASTTATAGYTLFSLGAGGDLQTRKGHTFAKFYLAVNNLANTTYMDYMSRFKYYPVNNLTGRVGVFNMGRNVSIKLDIPLDFKKG
jgi:iron complex outermembrane receptor protein